MAKPPGSTVPGSATTTRSPTAKLVAPQMMPRGAISPTSTWQYRIGFFNPGSSSKLSTRPIRSGPVTSGGWWISSTSSPTRTKASAISASVMPSGSSTWSASHDTETRTCSLLASFFGLGLRPRSAVHAECAGEPHVTLGQVAHVRQPVAELQGAFQAHAEREAGVPLSVHPAGPEHVRVDHAAATPLHPARAALLLREPDVHLGGRLGEREVGRPQPGRRAE